MNVFVPHTQCSVPSGDCFSEGKCLNQCKADARKDCQAKILDLRRRVARLEQIVYMARLHEQQGGET